MSYFCNSNNGMILNDYLSDLSYDTDDVINEARLRLLRSREMDPRVFGKHRHLRITDCLMVRVFFISTVNGRSKKTNRKEAFMSCASSGHINKT